MNYPQSKQILKEIKKANKILINCHRSPDPDSIASALSVGDFLKSLKKDFTIVCSDEIAQNFSYIGDIQSIKTVDLNEVDYEEYDVFVILDSSEWTQAGLDSKPKIKVINIDHHPKSAKEGGINICDLTKASTTEILYYVFLDWKYKFSNETATRLLVGICYDTNFFINSNTNFGVHCTAAKLLERGADNYYVAFNMTMNIEINALYLWRDFLNNFQIDNEHKFLWSAVSFEEFSKHQLTQSITSMVSENIFRRFQGVNFVITMCEKSKNKLSMSLRSRDLNFDVSEIAREIGGNGHKVAAGAALEGLPFKKAVAKVLRVARKYAKKQYELQKNN